MLPEVIESIGFVNMEEQLTSCANMTLSPFGKLRATPSPSPRTGEGSQN